VLGERDLHEGRYPTPSTSRHPQLDHHPLVPFVIDREMAMKEKAAVFLKVRARRSCAPDGQDRGA
jgi:hypothetical protein